MCGVFYQLIMKLQAAPEAKRGILLWAEELIIPGAVQMSAKNNAERISQEDCLT